MPKEVKYDSLPQKFLTERDTRDMLGILIMILDKMFPKFFEQNIDAVAPRADGEQHALSYTKPV